MDSVQKYGRKKDVGETSLLIPLVLAFALPIYQDKQLSQPTPIAYYIIGMLQECSPHHIGIHS